MSDEDNNSTLSTVMKNYPGKNMGQISIQYLLQLKYAVVFLSTSKERMVSNHAMFGKADEAFTLSDDDMERLKSVARPDGNWGLMSPYDIL